MTIDTNADYVEYCHNNSGGSDWLLPADWKALADAGWEIERFEGFGLDGKPYMARRQGLGLMEAVDEWTRITGACATDAGCACCGPPHRFTAYQQGKYYASGPNIRYEATWE